MRRQFVNPAQIIENFNPRTRVECDSGAVGSTTSRIRFQSTHSCRVRPILFHVYGKIQRFQSTHSCRVRRISAFTFFIIKSFQSTHSCRVRQDTAGRHRRRGVFQSTHSCRVRLAALPGNHKIHSNFNPRTRVECDLRESVVQIQKRNFNPRTRVECDSEWATDGGRSQYFNPRTRVECDTINRMCWDMHTRFQSTHSCRVRQYCFGKR